MELAFVFNLAAGFFFNAHKKAAVDEDTVVDRDLMGSTLLITKTQSTDITSS